MKTYECQSWDDFIATLRLQEGRQVGTPTYRGHRELEWKLSSLWERHLERMKGDHSDDRKVDPKQVFPKIRDGYLSAFKHFAVGLPGLRTGGIDDVTYGGQLT